VFFERGIVDAGNASDGFVWLQLMSDIGVKDSMISRLEKTVQELQEEVGFYVFAVCWV
jgi:hypothetical protein